MSETLHIQMKFVLKYLFFILLAVCVCVCVHLGLEPGFEVDSTLECSKRF